MVGEREDFKIHRKVIKLALSPLRREGLTLQWPAAPRGGEVRRPGETGKWSLPVCPQTTVGGTLLCLFSEQSDTEGQKHCLAAKGSSIQLLLGCLQ